MCTLLPVLIAGCDPECAPHVRRVTTAPGGAHVAQQWIKICGFPGSALTDVVSVSKTPSNRPPGQDTIIFDEEVDRGADDLISASWVDENHLDVTVSGIGEFENSPHQVAGVVITYILGSGVNLSALAEDIKARTAERSQWERLKTSAAWSYVEPSYVGDADVIQRNQKFIEWARTNIKQSP